ESIEKLGLAGDDKTGGWMLNYPFPYDKEKVIHAYKAYSMVLKDAAMAKKKEDLKRLWPVFAKKRKAFQESLSLKDYAYFSFQVWQEGLASHTAYSLLCYLKDYKPSSAFNALGLKESIQDYWKIELDAHLVNLTALELGISQRVCFYAIGVAEGILLDRLNPGWRQSYFSEKFFIENYAEGFQIED